MRARNIKPGFFKNENMAELDTKTRLLFIGLWCYADREGLFEWRPKRIKAEIFPYDDGDIACNLMSLQEMSFIEKYGNEVDGYFGRIINFKSHQRPHPHEKKSIIPKPQEIQVDTEKPRNVITCNEMSPKCTSDIRNEDIRKEDTLDNSDEQSGASWRDGFNQDVIDFVESFQQHIRKEVGSKAPKPTESLFKSASDTVDKLIRLDGHNLDEIKTAMRWAVQNDFWQRNALSLASLRKKSDGLTKFQKILAASSEKPKTQTGYGNAVYQDYECT